MSEDLSNNSAPLLHRPSRLKHLCVTLSVYGQTTNLLSADFFSAVSRVQTAPGSLERSNEVAFS